MKYFKPHEFACKCGCGAQDMDPGFLAKIDQARETAGIPFIVTSGRRCKSHNHNVGSRPTSSHLKGLAVDIKAVGSRERYLILAALMDAGFNRFGIDSVFIHVDADPDKDPNVIWGY